MISEWCTPTRLIAAREPRPIVFNRLVMPVQSPHANGPAGGLPLELVTYGDLSGGDRTGHDRPVPRHGE